MAAQHQTNLQRKDNVPKRTSIDAAVARPISSTSSAASTAHSHLFDYASMARGDSYGSVFTPPPDETLPYHTRRNATVVLDAATVTTTSPSMKRRAVRLAPETPPRNKGTKQPPRGRPSPVSARPIGTTLRDPGPVSLPGIKNSPNRNYTSPRAPRTAQLLQPGSPSTPVRRKSAKELISHFEGQSASKDSPSAPFMKLSASTPTPTRMPLSEARLNGPLPAIPLQEPKFPSASPSRSPIRSLMNMVGLGKKGKFSGDGGRRTSPSPTPKRRALLAEDDDAPIARLSFGERLHDAEVATLKTLADDYLTPVRDVPLYGENGTSEDPVPVLRSGLLMYASPTTNALPSPTWYSTQATLQAPTLSLRSSAFLPPDSASATNFRSFNLRHATVESHPSILIDALKSVQLELPRSSPSRPSDVTAYPFEVTFPDPSSGIPGSGPKEVFATMSAWDRGKWVCQIWDAICSANVPPDTSIVRKTTSTSESSGMDSESSEQTHGTDGGSHTRLGATTSSSDSDNEDPYTHRLQPPLRVVNVSKLSAFFDSDSIHSRQTFTSSDDSCQPLSSAYTEASTTSTTDAFTNIGASSARPYSVRGTTLRSAPLAAPHPYNCTPDKEKRAMKTRSRSVPSSPSINDLGKMTLVQQRLARFESTKASVSPVRTDRGRTLLPEAQRQLSHPTPGPPEISLPPAPPPSTIGLSTPPVSPYIVTSRPPRPVLSRLSGTATVIARDAKQDADDKPDRLVAGVLTWKPPALSPLKASFVQAEEMTEPSPAVSDVFTSNNVTSHTEAQSNRWSRSTGSANPDTEYRLSAITSLPSIDYPDIGPLFSLVRDTAKEQAAQVEALAAQLNSIRKEIKCSDGDDRAGSIMAPSSSGQSLTDDWEVKAILDEIQEKLNTFNPSQASAMASSDALAHLQGQLDGIRDEDFPLHYDELSTIRGQVAAVQSTLTAVNETNLTASSKLDGLAENVLAIDISGIHNRLDGMRALLEAIAQVPAPVSAFRNAGKAPPPIDLSTIYTKLDALANAPKATDLDGDVRGKLDAMLGLCKEIAAKGGTGAASDGGEMEKLLIHLQEDQSNQQKYYTDLNSWLQTNATQTGGQFHAISTQLGQLSHALTSVAEADGTTDLNNVPGSEPDGQAPKGNLFLDIRQALAEINSRDRTNDNFLAAANHLIGAANAERQNLAALIASQKEENQKSLAQFAEKIAVEIRGQKHSFVDAMEKATAINVEGQLRELKTHISTQLLDMARGVEQLLEERKGLEAQISDLLAFKNRFATPESLERAPVSPGQYVSALPQQQPGPRQAHRHSPLPSSAQMPQPNRYPDRLYQTSSGGSSRPLPNPATTPTQRRQLPMPQPGRRF